MNFYPSVASADKFIFFLISPLPILIALLIRKALIKWTKEWVEGFIYTVSPYVDKYISSCWSIKQYCKNKLKSNNLLLIPATRDISFDIDRMFIPLTLHKSGEYQSNYTSSNLITAGNRFFVVGDPGSGKSSLLKKMFRDLCQNGIEQPKETMLPLYIELKDLDLPIYPDKTDLGHHIYSHIINKETKNCLQYNIKDSFTIYTKTNGLVLLFDGLDEVANENYSYITEALLSLSEYLFHVNTNNVIVITSRIQFYRQVKDDFVAAFPTSLYIQPFTASNIYDFLANWPEINAKNFDSEKIFRNLTNRPSLKELCTNPLILSMYVAEEQFSMITSTPETRTEFYKKIVDELIYNRRNRILKNEKKYSIKTKEFREIFLGKIAFDNLLDTNQFVNSLDWNKAIDIIKNIATCDSKEAEDLFNIIANETGIILEEKKSQTFRFIHRTFCEFFCAKEAIEGNKNGWVKLINSQRNILYSKFKQMRIRLLETTPFALALINNREQRINAFDEVTTISNDMLTIFCLLETKLYKHKIWNNLIKRFEKKLLQTPERKWDEHWYYELRILNTIIDDFNITTDQYNAKRIDIKIFYQKLLSKQANSFEKIIRSLSNYDAAIAFDVMEIFGKNIVENYTNIIVDYCDQIHFFDLVIQKMAMERSDFYAWSCILVEAALKNKIVAKRLIKKQRMQIFISMTRKLSRIERIIYTKKTSNCLYVQLLLIIEQAKQSEFKINPSLENLQKLLNILPIRDTFFEYIFTLVFLFLLANATYVLAIYFSCEFYLKLILVFYIFLFPILLYYLIYKSFKQFTVAIFKLLNYKNKKILFWRFFLPSNFANVLKSFHKFK